MEQDDEEFEQLLHEIPQATSPDTPNEAPRATSAPPHLEELQRVYGQNVDAHDFGLRPEEIPVKPFIDIRCDEQYEDFYKSYSGAKKLPPPMGENNSNNNRSMYNDLPVLSPKASQLSYNLEGLQLDSPRTRHRKQHHQKQQMFQREPAPVQHFSNSSSNQMFGEPKMTSAFGNLNFDGRGLQTIPDEVGENGQGTNGQGPVDSNGIYDAFGAGSGVYGAASTRSPPPMDLFPRASSAMDALGNGLYNGMGDFTSSHAVKELLRQGSPGLNSYRGNEPFGSAVSNPSEAVLEAVARGPDLFSNSSQQQILYEKDYFESQRPINALAQAQAQAAAYNRYAQQVQFQMEAQMEDEKRKQR